jgi:2-(1,2-epoxy-1,2-dihydrophenyl)acetyl-CoA isomerase
MDADAVIVDESAGVLTIRMNSPATRNALGPAVEHGLVDALARATSADVRAVVLTGTPPAFCAGASTEELGGNDARDQATLAARARVIPDAILVPLYRLAKPVIAAVNGWAVGAGVGLALAADFRVFAADARLRFGFRRVALAPDLATCWMLPRLVGLRAARDLLTFDRVIEADEALAVGIADEVVAPEDFDARVGERAAELAAEPTLAFAAMKQMLQRAFELDLTSFLEREVMVQTMLVRSDDHREGVEALVGRREPKFLGR